MTDISEESYRAGSEEATKLRNLLFENKDAAYAELVKKLTPGCGEVIGVRAPVLRKIAKEIAKGDWRAFIKEYEEEYYEDRQLKAYVIGCQKGDIEELLGYVRDFVSTATCWANIDSLCSVFKIARDNRERVFEFIEELSAEGGEFRERTAAVILLSQFHVPEYAERAFALLDSLKNEGYYLKMGVAWAISEYYIRMPEITLEYMRRSTVDDFTLNKAISKIKDSYRVSEEDKKRAEELKRKQTK